MATKDKEWMRPAAKEGSSDVWKYFELELPDKKRVRCNKCPSKYFTFSGATNSMWYHLERVHHIHKPGRSQAFIQTLNSRGRQSQIQSATSNTNESATSNSVSSSAVPSAPNPTSETVASPSITMTQMSIAESFARADAKHEPRDKIYARMAAKDRFSFFTMARSYDIQQRISKDGHKPLLCEKSVAR